MSYVIAGENGLTSEYGVLCKVNNDDTLKLIACRKVHKQYLQPSSVLRYNFDNMKRFTKRKVVDLRDPEFINIINNHYIREECKQELGEWLRAKLVELCGEEILKTKVTASDFKKPEYGDSFNEQYWPNGTIKNEYLSVLESDESLGFININK